MAGDRAGSGSRLRRWGAVALVVLTCVLFLVTILAVGATRLLLDTDRFSAAVDRSLQEPTVSDALAGYLADQITTAVSEAGVVDRIVPDELDRLVPVINAALGSVVESRSQEFVSSDRGRELVVDAVALAHRAAIRVLEDKPAEGGLVVVLDDQVALNLVPVAVAVLDRVQASGIVPDLDLPELDRSMTPAEQIDAVNDSLGTDLQGDFAQLTVYERPASGDQSLLAQARRALQLLKATVWLLVIVTVLMAVLAVVVAPNRLRILLWLAAGLGLAALLAHALVNRLIAAVPELLDDPEARAAARDVVRRTLESLDQSATRLAVLFLLIALTLLVIGASQTPRVLDALRGLADRSPDVVRFGGLGIAALVVLLFGFDLLPLVLAAAIGIGGFVLTGGIGGVGGPSTDEVPPSPSLPAQGASGRHTP